MAITNSFKNAVAANDVRGIRIMMKDSLLVDPTFVEFNEMDNLAGSVNGLYDVHDGREFIDDKSAWNDDYMNKLMVQVVGNFSRERMEHLKDVVKQLRPVTARRPSANNYESTKGSGDERKTNNNYQEQKRRDQANGSYRGAKIAIGAVVGGIVGGAIAGGVGNAVTVGAVVIGAVVIGVVVGGAVGAVAGVVIGGAVMANTKREGASNR
ncbi:MAG: hypothetical protein LBP75_11250 [Planctomycetota bacterium]|jgi:hypothetical protein|nr:hypothetical protein [Planctomycetota bacterium]